MFEKPKRYPSVDAYIVYFYQKGENHIRNNCQNYSKSSYNHMQIIFQYFLKRNITA
jgi:hypothetical protein